MSLHAFSTNKLRQSYLEFFNKRGHKTVPSASLVPQNDPTVLFTTAGMHPLVPYLMGENHPEGKRLVNIQPCLRTDDIEEVGDDVHLTFFEMLGNWSLGDGKPKSKNLKVKTKDNETDGYWKEDAIKWSFEYLTKELGIEIKNIAVSCFVGDSDAPRDDESAQVWKSLGVAENRIAFLGKKDNWWGPAGEMGPCGPDTEMFVWVGDGKAPEKFEGPEDSRWVEVWNDVFMEYDKEPSDEGWEKSQKGETVKDFDFIYKSIKQKNVDTGMGLERMLAYLQGKSDIFQTELFWPIIERIEELSGKKYEGNKKDFRIIADHIKASVFILSERIIPSNKLHGYVLRRLIRRAITKSISLGIKQNFCKQLAEPVFDIYKNAYGQLEKNRDFILAEIEKEEIKFRKNVNNFISEMNEKDEEYQSFIRDLEIVGSMKERRNSEDWKRISINAEQLFSWYQSHGIPFEVAIEEAKKRNIPIEEHAEKTFHVMVKNHQEKSRTASAGIFKGGLADNSEVTTKMHTATHLLLSALREILGDQIIQRGSNITPERIRFDFSHDEKLTAEQIKQVEDLVNQKIKEDLPVEMKEMTLEEAKKLGVMGVFDDKYGAKVKVYSVENPSTSSGSREGYFSRELCGGPHVTRTGKIGNFKIIKEESSSAGVRRIKAVVK